MGLEFVAFFFQLLPEFKAIVDFAVKNGPNGTILIRHRLFAVGKVDNGKSPVGQADSAFYENAFVVGPPVRDGLAHRIQYISGHRFSVGIDYSSYSTHDSVISIKNPLLKNFQPACYAGQRCIIYP
jgi:hypothetical protein